MPRPFVLLSIALLVAAALGLTAAWLIADLPADWRAATAVGAILAAVAAGIGVPLLARSRWELTVAQRLLESAAGELARVNDDLRQTAAARDRALSDLRASAEERQMFLNSIAHELNSPLTVIKGHVQLMAGRLEKDEQPEREQLVRGISRIQASVRQLTDLVEELLWLARLDIDQQVALDRRPTDLVALVRGVVDEQAATTNRHRIRFEAGNDRLVGRWDPRRLGRAIANLVANAIKFSPNGGDVRVAVAVEIGVAETAEARDALAVVTVRDQGVGIAAADLPHVFERFYRGERVKHMTSGSGLGLAAVKHAVEAHGGSVSVDSREGSGATFTVRLPLDGSGETGVERLAAPEHDPSEADRATDH